MVASRLRSVGVVWCLALASMLAGASIWAASAESRTGDRTPQVKTTNVQILGVNDFHGNLESPRSLPRDGVPVPVGGAAYLDAYLDEYEGDNPKRTIRVHAGDMVGASPLISSYFHDEPAVYAMNSMGFDVGTVGNHEFDEGGEELLRLINGGRRDDGKQFKDGPDGEPINTSDPSFPGADFPYTAANTVYKKTGKTLLPPYRIVEKDGEKIGFIGVTTEDTPNIVTPDAIAPFEYKDISETVNKYVKELRKKDVRAVVVLAHSGGFETSGAEATGEILDETGEMSNGVDVVVAGHSHSKLNQCVDDKTDEVESAEGSVCKSGKLVAEAFALGTAFDAVDMKINRRTGDVANASAEIVTTYQDEVRPDAKTAAIVAEYKEKITPISERVVGTASEDISRDPNASGESELGDLIADAQRDFAKADFAFMNPGGIRADIASGPVTYGELFTVQPFDNQVVKLELTGDQVYAVLEQQFGADGRTRILQVSGLKFTYDSTKPAGQKITSVTLPGGTPIDRAATYTVAANSFIATGGDGFTVLKDGKNPQTLGSDLDALEAYIDSLPQPFDAPDPATEGRITKQG